MLAILLDVRRALAQQTASGYLHSAVLAPSLAFSFLFLAAQVLLQFAAIGVVSIHMQIKRFMTHKQLARDLLGNPLQNQQNQQNIRLTLDPLLNLACIATALRANQRQLTGLLGSVATTACIAAKLTADRELAAPKLIRNLRDGLIDIHEAVNLISFDLAEVFVINHVTSTGRSRSTKC